MKIINSGRKQGKTYVDKVIKEMSCPLCGLKEREPENILAVDGDDWCYLARTKKLKGHKERLMIVAKKHGDRLIWQHYTNLWREEIKTAFGYTYKVKWKTKSYNGTFNSMMIDNNGLDPKTWYVLELRTAYDAWKDSIKNPPAPSNKM